MPLEIQASQATARYRQLAEQMRQQFPRPDGSCVVLSTGVKTQPFNSEYPDADLFLGSHIDSDPKSEDKIHVMSYRPEAQGETILEECFTERQERPHFFSPKTQMLHVYALKFHSPGGSLLEAALTSVDLRTGEVMRNQTGREACDGIHKLGLDYTPRG